MCDEVVKLEIAKYEPKRGDLLIFRVSKNISKNQLDELTASLSEIVPEFVKTVVVCDDVQIELITNNDDSYPYWIYER